MKLCLCFICCCLLAGSLRAQAPAIQWQQCYGGSNSDMWPNAIAPTTDGGFILGATTMSQDGDVQGYHGTAPVGDFWVVKLNKAGAVQWQRCVGGEGMEYLGDLQQTPDGGYIAVGITASTDCIISSRAGVYDIWLVKLAADGQLVWQRTFGSSGADYGRSVAITKDGGYIVCGTAGAGDGDVTAHRGNADAWILKVDGVGNLQWQQTLGGSGYDAAYAIKETPDGGYIVTGSTESADGDVQGNHGSYDAWVIKLDGRGALQWQRPVGGSGTDEAFSVQVTGDGSYIVAGYTDSNDGDCKGNHGQSDIMLVRLSATGTLQWLQCYGGKENERGHFVQNTPGGGYVLAGSAESADGDATCNAGRADCWVLQTDEWGNLQWQKNMGGSEIDEALCVQPLEDGGFIVAATTCSPNNSNWHAPGAGTNNCFDVWVARLEAAGAAPKPPSVTIQSPPVVCAGTPALFMAFAQYAGSNPAFAWTKNGVAVGTNSLLCTISNPQDGDVVACTVTAGGDCFNSSQQARGSTVIQINHQNIRPVLHIATRDSLVCNCTPLRFEASVTGGVQPLFQWNINGENTGEYSAFFVHYQPKENDVISFTYRDRGACLPADEMESRAITLQPFTNQQPSVQVTVPFAVACAGTPVTFYASAQYAGPNPGYEWQLNGKTLAGYGDSSFTASNVKDGDVINCIVHVDPQYGCANGTAARSPDFVVQTGTKGMVTIAIKASGGRFCKGTPVQFVASTTYTGRNPIYEWRVNNRFASASDSVFISTSLQDGDVVHCIAHVDPVYAACATNDNVVSNEIVVSLSENIPPTLAVEASGNNVCAGTPVRFTATAQNAGTTPVYHWLVNGVDAGAAGRIFEKNNLHNGDRVECKIEPGENSCGTLPVFSSPVAITVHDTPVVVIQPAADTLVPPGSRVMLVASVAGGTANLAYGWSPTAGVEAPLALATYTTALTQTTLYSFSATTPEGCTARNSITIKVPGYLFLPSAFTPNGDGRNDVFRIPPNSDIILHQLAIYDRWGRQLFVSRDKSKGWDGTCKGAPMPTGTYIYLITGENEKGAVQLKGSFNLLR